MRLTKHKVFELNHKVNYDRTCYVPNGFKTPPALTDMAAYSYLFSILGFIVT